MSSPMPTDFQGHVTSSGTGLTSFSVPGDGTFKPIVLPEDCKGVLITARDDLPTFTHIDTPTEFHLSSFANGTDWIPVTGITLSIAKSSSAACYVRSAVGIRVVCLGWI